MRGRCGSTNGTRLQATIALVVVVGMLAMPAVVAGSADDPEVQDPTRDAASWITHGPDRPDVGIYEPDLDIAHAWIEETTWPRRAPGQVLRASVDVVSFCDTPFVCVNGLEGNAYAFAFRHDGDDYVLTSAAGGQVLRNGDRVADARVETVEVHGPDKTQIGWVDYEDHLGTNGTLTDVFAYTQEGSLTDRTACHGRMVADCGPDAGFGDDYVLEG